MQEIGKQGQSDLHQPSCRHAGILLRMTLDDILSSIDLEIEKLKQARALLSDLSKTNGASPVHKRRKMSAASRKKIAEAQRKRWAAQKKTA